MEKEISGKEQKKDWKKILHTIFFPHTFVVFLLFNITVAGLIYIFSKNLNENPIAIAFYVVAFYTLILVCLRIPSIVKNTRAGIYKNRYANAYLTDEDLRMRINMYRGLLINFCFATFKIIFGFLYHSSWLFAMAGYNLILSIMRFVVIFRSQAKGFTEEEERRRGLESYHVCGWLMLLLNIAVSVIIFMVIFQNQTIEYHMIVTIALAAFTFYSFTIAIINMVKYHKQKNPVYAAVKRIDMVKSIVSVFTLQVAMLTNFNIPDAQTKEGGVNTMLMNALTGIAVMIAINTIGAFMIHGAKQEFKEKNAHGE